MTAIETGIPVPNTARQHGEAKYPLQQLTEPGQSFLQVCATKADQDRIRVYASIYGKRNGKVFVTQKDDDGNVRVWLKAIDPDHKPLRPGYSNHKFTQRLRDLQVGQYIDRKIDPPKPSSIRVQIWMIANETGRTFKTFAHDGYMRITRST